MQLSTYVDDITDEDTAKKYEVWGWSVISINGNDAHEIRMALKNQKTQKPTITLL